MPRPARPWFRLYSDILDNDKVAMLKPAQFRNWIKLLAISNVTTPRGSLPPIGRVAYRLRCSEATALASIQEFIPLHFIDEVDGSYVMHDWTGKEEGWQYESDARATDGRRETDEARRKEGGKWVNPPHKRGDSAAHAPQTRGEETEADTDTETDQSQSARDPIDQLVADFASFGETGSGTVKAIEWAVKDHGLEAVQRAVRKAAATATGERVRFSYVETILEGKGDNANNRSNTAAQLPAIPDDPDAPGYKNPRRVSSRRAVGGTPGPDTAPDTAGVGDDR